METKKTVLVADDEPGFRALFKYMLEPRGFIVEAVENGEEALNKSKENDYAVILLDVHMPKMTGPEALRNIRHLKPQQPVIILSSSAEPDKVRELVEGLGASACFQKPFDTQDLMATIEKLISQP